MQRDLFEQYALERLSLKNGKSAKITYDEKQQPSVSVILQQLYDVNENPKVAAGCHRHRPSPLPRAAPHPDHQRSRPLSYPAVKNPLKGRYPKHEWR